MPENIPKSPYSWLIAPGEKYQQTYGTRTRCQTWYQVSNPAVTVLSGQNYNNVSLTAADKQIIYGQWIAQLVTAQTGVDLAGLYFEGTANWPPITLSDEVISRLAGYFQDT